MFHKYIYNYYKEAMSKIILLAVLLCIINAKFHSRKSVKKVSTKRPYGELNPRDTIGIQMKYK